MDDERESLKGKGGISQEDIAHQLLIVDLGIIATKKADTPSNANRLLRSSIAEIARREVIEEFISSAETAEDMLNITKAFIETCNNLETSTGKAYAYFLRRMFLRLGEILEDSDGMAEPDKIALMIEPALDHFLSDGSMMPKYKSDIQSGRTIHSMVSAELNKLSGLTAEGVAAHKVRDLLVAKGHSRLGVNRTARRYMHVEGHLFITDGAFRRICQVAFGSDTDIKLPEKAESLELLADTITRTIGELAKTKDDQGQLRYPVAQQLAGALDKLSQDKRTEQTPGSRKVAFTELIHIANILSNQLMQYSKLPEGVYSLPELNTQDLLNLPAAFQRILLAIDPELLMEAAYRQDPDNISKIRARMLVVEELSAVWAQEQRRHTISVEDALVRLVASGMNVEGASKAISAILKHDSNPQGGGVAIRSLRPYSNRCASDRAPFRPGYGPIS